MLVSLFWQGQKDLNPRHAVLEWMWENASKSGKWTVLPSSPGQVTNERCWFGAGRKFSEPKQAKKSRKIGLGILKNAAE